jgi:hypothetical protein
MNKHLRNLILLGCIFFVDFVHAESWAGASFNFSQYTDPQFSGSIQYATRSKLGPVGNDNTWVYFKVNVSSIQFNSLKPIDIRITTSTEFGAVQKVATFGKFDIFTGGTTGLTTNGSNLGWSFTNVNLALTPIGRGWFAGPHVLWGKSTIGDIQWALGLTLGWGDGKSN